MLLQTLLPIIHYFLNQIILASESVSQHAQSGTVVQKGNMLSEAFSCQLKRQHASCGQHVNMLH